MFVRRLLLRSILLFIQEASSPLAVGDSLTPPLPYPPSPLVVIDDLSQGQALTTDTHKHTLLSPKISRCCECSVNTGNSRPQPAPPAGRSDGTGLISSSGDIGPGHMTCDSQEVLCVQRPVLPVCIQYCTYMFCAVVRLLSVAVGTVVLWTVGGEGGRGGGLFRVN